MATANKHHDKFCSYCHAKGLPESQFASHFVKDKPGKDGKVVCPELLKNECGYCHEVGHTPKFCPKLKARDQRRRAAARRSKKAPRPTARSADGKPPTPTRNFFQSLTGYTEPQAAKEQFPALPGAKAPAAPRGIWGGGGAAQQIEALKAQLAKMQAELATSTLTASETAWLANQEEQLEEETAEGEAFFDNVAQAQGDAEQLHAAAPAASSGATPAAGCTLPACCDLDADFGDKAGDGWGSDDE